MTFNEWYDTSVKPGLELQLAAMPPESRELIRIASRKTMVACWNCAVEACADICGASEGADFGIRARLLVG
jgi:hypothetical protein